MTEPTPEQQEEWLTPREASALTKLSLQTLANHRSLNIGIPYTKLSSGRAGRVRYRRKDVERYLGLDAADALAAEAVRQMDADPHGLNAGMVVKPYTERGQEKWVFRCWGTTGGGCDGWLGLGHHSEQSAQRERDRHVAEAHATEEQAVPSLKRILIDPPNGATVLAARHLDATEGPVQVGSAVDAATRSAITTVLRYVARAHNSPVAPADGRDEGAERVRALHVRNPHSGTCEHCSAGDYPDYAVRSPCPTIRALDGEDQ